jgi:hypothetical protein
MEEKARSQATVPIWVLIHLTHGMSLLCFLPLKLEILPEINLRHIIKMMTVRLFLLKERLRRFLKLSKLHSLYMNTTTK